MTETNKAADSGSAAPSGSALDKMDAFSQYYRKRSEETQGNGQTVSQHNYMRAQAENYELCAVFVRDQWEKEYAQNAQA